MFAMLVEEELRSWPEQNTRSRKWLTVSEAANSCRHPWMRDALIGGFSDETTTSGGSAAV
ncbi:UNVERIFIED_CONTAM: Nudix hydrolase 16, mitochondrial [Sesamum radiatum]